MHRNQTIFQLLATSTRTEHFFGPIHKFSGWLSCFQRSLKHGRHLGSSLYGQRRITSDQLKDNYGSTCRFKNISRFGMIINRVNKNHFLRLKSQGMRFAAIDDPLWVSSQHFSWPSGDTLPINDPNQSSCIAIKQALSMMHNVSRRQIRVMNSARSEDSCREPCTGSRTKVERRPEPSM